MTNHRLIVSKFGGSSMASEREMEKSAHIARQQKSTVIVVSATSGSTDRLASILETAANGDWPTCEKIIFNLREKHFDIHHAIGKCETTFKILKDLLSELETLAKGVNLLKEKSPKAVDQTLSIGERLSSALFCQLFRKIYPEVNSELFDVRNLLVTDEKYGKAKPLVRETALKARDVLKDLDNKIIITQGFIGATEEGLTTTLGRGGSDYSAALIAEALEADALEIWTDVDGLATIDPRVSSRAQKIKEITYEEAQEMARYGAKILHPTTLLPAMRHGIPVFVGCSQNKEPKGTWIKSEASQSPLIRAITQRRNEALITINNSKLSESPAIAARIYEIFAKHDLPVDCVTTSEISMAFSVTSSALDSKYLKRDLESLGTISYEEGFNLISVIGNRILSTPGLAKDVFNSLGNINARMICLGASSHSFNLLVDEADGDSAARRLHDAFITEEE